jgi:putative phosphonate metabolism protein
MGASSTGVAAEADAPRYAIYFVPPANSALYRFGAGFLGYDSYSGRDLGPPPDLGMDVRAWEELTCEPRKYGFHATLKAPFRLRTPCTEADLLAALDRFARVPCPAATITPVLATIGRFVAVVPQRTCPALDRLAADCVTAFDDFRAPLPPQERRTRIDTGLTARQTEHLDRWGYPYVLDDFRFHMTLTGAIEDAARGDAVELLSTRFSRLDLGCVLAISRLVLLRQPSRSSPFRVLQSTELT